MNGAAATEGVVTGKVRLWLRAEGLAVLVLSLLFYGRLDLHWWIFFVLLLIPDLSMAGYLINPKVGGAAYNLVHNYFAPVAMIAVAVATRSTNLIPYFCIWTAHIGLDRLLGYGLKYPTSFSKTHLGILGKVSA